MTNASELLPCPFCGGEALAIERVDFHEVCCLPCTAAVQEKTRQAAITAWNTRQVTQLEAQLAEVQSRIAEQITHAKTRIADGDEMGARVWRIALEDIVRENSALLTQSKEPK